MFRLSAVLPGHTGDVKSVSAGPRGGIITGSRDKSAIVFAKDPSTPASFSPAGAINHSNFVNAVAFVPPHAAYPEGLILTAGRENVIYAHQPGNLSTPALVMVGHTDNVCALRVAGSADAPLVLSASWDKTARVWKDGQCIATLQGHSLAVWSVLALDNGDILTGSADKTIKVWRNGQCVKTLTGHADCVRDLALLPSIGFVSCANDSSVRVWAADGECIQELYGHTAFVYSVDVLGSGEIVSAGEDRTVRVWRDGECVQSITHPSISVWCVRVLPNGDLVTGTNDGFARVFTRSQERLADEITSATFDQALASFAIPKNQVGDLNSEKIPGPEALEVPGKSTGDVKVVKVNGNVEAYQWSAELGRWEKIGDVVDAVGEQRKTLHQGKEYDYVFDVDIGDGLPTRKLAYNVNENPYTAAQNFIHREELSQTFLDQIASFIVQNTKGATLGMGSGPSDPYTGGGRYAGGAPAPQQALGDPFTGTGAYTTSAYSQGTPAPSAEGPQQGYYPKKTYILFNEAKLQQPLGKILELNQSLTGTEKQLTSSECELLSAAAEVLSGSNHASPLRPGTHQVMQKLLAWPQELNFPALDVFRCYVLHPSGAEAVGAEGEAAVRRVLEAGGFETPSPPKAVLNSQLLALRTFSNLLSSPRTRPHIWQHRHRIFEASKKCGQGDWQALRVAYFSLLLNWSVALLESRDDQFSQLLCEEVLGHLGGGRGDGEERMRQVVALGTLACASPAARGLLVSRPLPQASQEADQKVSNALHHLALLLS